jgi:hypothetical protein
MFPELKVDPADIAKTALMTLNGRGLPFHLKCTQNAYGQFVLPWKLSKSRSEERRDGCESL